EYFPGWEEDISGARTIEDLPKNAQNYISALEKLAGVRISGVGVGPGRDEVIQVRDLIYED
ncbi:MAG: adenylosuccinate synthetase, partial [Yaniella sp.]|nr:adenylosuccinate synthetase [Yaniella sp.]